MLSLGENYDWELNYSKFLINATQPQVKNYNWELNCS